MIVSTDICRLDAVEMVRQLRAGSLSAREAVRAHLAQIERLNPAMNAIVTLVADRAMDAARVADDRAACREPLGPLHGLPIAHKDLQPTNGIRTTFGSPVFRDHVPDHDSLLVERVRTAGAILVGKTNTPEFGAGSQTFNPVFGATVNPHDRTKTCGGSSGGAAVALACGMLPIADGTDMGGSLRNPANFCGVVGMRTSAGRVPIWPAPMGWSTLSVDGPMGRTVADTALLLSAIAGPDPRSPIGLSEPGSSFAAPLGRELRGVRVAWWTGLGGIPVDRQVRAIVDAQRHVFESLGCVVEDAEPDLSDADEVFMTRRAVVFAGALGDVVRTHADLVKDTVRWEVERGERLTAAEVAAAEVKATNLFQRMQAFMSRREFFVLPVAQVLPFDVTQPYVTEIDGVPMRNYIDWMRTCYYISATGHPAISVPAGFTPDGLPVGIQIVGRYRDDWGLLQVAHAFEQARALPRRWPAHDTQERPLGG